MFIHGLNGLIHGLIIIQADFLQQAKLPTRLVAWVKAQPKKSFKNLWLSLPASYAFPWANHSFQERGQYSEDHVHTSNCMADTWFQ